MIASYGDVRACMQTPKQLSMSLADWSASSSCDFTIDVVSCLLISSNPSSHSNISAQGIFSSWESITEHVVFFVGTLDNASLIGSLFCVSHIVSV